MEPGVLKRERSHEQLRRKLKKIMPGFDTQRKSKRPNAEPRKREPHTEYVIREFPERRETE